MSLQRNITASYASQIYVSIIGIAILPLYLKYMGAETYGLVGFFTMLQVWFNILDMGLTPTMARETARFRGGVTSAIDFRRLWRALQLIFFLISFFGATALFYFSDILASRWLNVQKLSFEQVQFAVQLISLAVALRWMAGLYRGCISGYEKLVWLGGFNAAMATLRFVFVLPFMIWMGNASATFFIYQIFIATLEIIILITKSYNLLPKIPSQQKIGWSWVFLFTPIRSTLKFSLTIAFTSSVWILVTQTDKLLLSKLLPLADYGYFTLAVLAASGVIVISNPISIALLPRMAKLQAEGNERDLIDLYRNATQITCAIATPACLVLAFFPEQVLWAWTGNLHIGMQTASILCLYAIGNGILTMASFPYYLQFAKGDLQLHTIGNVVFLIFLVPLLIWTTVTYGAIGAGFTWASINAAYFLIWTPLVHKKFSNGLHKNWLFFDILLIFTPGLVIIYIISKIIFFPENRFYLFAILCLIACLLTITSLAGTKIVKNKLIALIKK